MYTVGFTAYGRSNENDSGAVEVYRGDSGRVRKRASHA